MSLATDCPTQKTDVVWKDGTESSEIKNCVICDSGNDYHCCPPKFRRLDPNGGWRQASEPEEDSVSHGTRVLPHHCGNYEHDCSIFQAFKANLMKPKQKYCPFCKLLNDRQCSHYDSSSGYGPVIKVCRLCNTFGKHWSDECPNIARDGPLPFFAYCRVCQSREHWFSDCPNA